MGKDQGSQDFNTVVEEVKTLATTKHEFKSLIIDSFTKLYGIAAAIAEATVGNDYGRDKKEANKPTRQLMRWIEAMDLSVILICHKKDKWARNGKSQEPVYAGTTFDGYDKLEYDLDLWLEVQKVGKIRTYTVKKSRIQTFEEGAEHPLEYKKFSELYGEQIINQEVKPVEMVTDAQLAEIQHLVQVVAIEPGRIDAFLKKNNADEYADLTSDKAAFLINELKKKVAGVK